MRMRAGFPAVQAYYGLRTYSHGGSYKLIQYPSAPAAPAALLPLACMGVLACVGVLARGAGLALMALHWALHHGLLPCARPCPGWQMKDVSLGEAPFHGSTVPFHL